MGGYGTSMRLSGAVLASMVVVLCGHRHSWEAQKKIYCLRSFSLGERCRAEPRQGAGADLSQCHVGDFSAAIGTDLACQKSLSHTAPLSQVWEWHTSSSEEAGWRNLVLRFFFFLVISYLPVSTYRVRIFEIFEGFPLFVHTALCR